MPAKKAVAAPPQSRPVATPLKNAPPDAVAAASYIADMSAQLMEMASSAHLDVLAYLLSMARVEAEIMARTRRTER